MAAIQDPWNALSIPFATQIDAFLRTCPEQDTLRDAPVAEQLATLSRLLKTPEYTIFVARLFSPLLVDLCARWLGDNEQDELKFAAFGLLVPAHEELYPTLSQFLSRPSLAKGPLGFITRQNASQIPLKTLHVLLLAYHRLLEACPHLHEEFHWPIIHLQSLCEPPHPDPGVRLLAIRCFARHIGMNEPARIQWEQKLVGTPDDVDPIIDTGFGETVDVWVLPILDHKRFIDERIAFYKTYALCKGPQILDLGLLCPRVTCIGGVLLLKSSEVIEPPTSFVQTTSTEQPLHQITKHLSLRHPILLSGPSSSGKLTLIHHLATCLHPDQPNHVVAIHLADTSLDARSLLGSYISSPTNPGTFQWREGVLVKAMKEGKFLVLENVDKASSEVLGTIWELVESLSMTKPIGAHAEMNVLGREKIRAKEGFALFATRSVSVTGDAILPPPSFLGHHKWMRVDLCQPTQEDLLGILATKFARLTNGVIVSILGIWESLQKLDQLQAIPSARPYGIRDLMKWCKRMEHTLPASSDSMDVVMESAEGTFALSDFIQNPIDREDVFLEARDIFFASLNPTKNQVKIKERAMLFAESLKIGSDRVEYLIQGRTAPPQLTKSQNGKITNVVIDRFTLDAFPSPPWTKQEGLSRHFALHRLSLNLLAALAGCIQANESALLTGETGTGKTTAVTYLASLLSHPLVSLNLSQQTESSDLIGGWKPVEARGPAQALQEKFMNLFSGTFSRERNVKYEEAIRTASAGGKWKRLVALWKEAAKRAQDRIDQRNLPSAPLEEETPRKRRKLDDGLRVSKEEWESFERDLDEFEKRHILAKSKAIFEFVEGPLVTALHRGHWILLDEINLASPETLEAISSILQASSGSITLSEQGDLTPVIRHPAFRLFACMNPATDVGKKDLPPHIRSHLTEIYVPPPDANRDALLLIIEQYIGQIALADRPAIKDVAEFYTAARKMAETGEIADGANLKPHYSMRTLTRALTFALDVEDAFPLRRALWEGILMAFSGVLEPKSAEVVRGLAMKCLLGKSNIGSLLAQVPAPPSTEDGRSYVSIGPFWLERGPVEPQPVDHYILTPSVQAKLLDLARIILTRRFPVLIEGPTSSGKTSAIEYLARLTGHRFVRINNHEHTDIQEYIGSYVTNPESGRLVFQDGLLVRALRRGDWIVLDELNLAPTDVLEAANRLLDDNRELLVPETGETIKPHPHFMIFATQNPPGLYGGRKILSRAFRNRFLEVHFQDVPQQELEQIIRERCAIAPSYAQRIVAVFQELQARRQTGRVFETKHGFATLRDLFRWAGRDAGSVQELAENGYMLIAERTRRDDDKMVVKEVIESVMKVSIDESAIYNLRNPQVAATLACPIPVDQAVVWTSAMQRLFILLARALRHNEPVLLVGETGSGKTSACELYAKTTNRDLKSLNCHQNTETADLLGGQRPIRNRALLEEAKKKTIGSLLGLSSDMRDTPDTTLLEQIAARLKVVDDAEEKSRLRQATALINQAIPLFEWQDGPLVLAMRDAGVFLLDEISLADDSVLERLNSVLEPSRTLVLAEKGGWDVDHVEITANDGFQLVATMNPGGDYGKKELSPALRNRFTEIWVPMVSSRDDRIAIVRASWKHAAFMPYSDAVVDFIDWVTGKLDDSLAFGLRDLLAWVQFSDQMMNTSDTNPEVIFHHAAHMVILDGLASLPQTQGWSSKSLEKLHQSAVQFLQTLVPSGTLQVTELLRDTSSVAIGPFKVPLGSLQPAYIPFDFGAPTTLENARRVLRACQLMKPILLEGSPGVGKTSLVTALAAASCQRLCRINLSDQTDLADLFGSDLPVEDGYPGEFAWKDAAFLQALQQGDWVLLDEMNLASQSVLEGLNAILDHRGTVYVPELGRSFIKHPKFRLFAAQNPVQQGGGRKGLPKSFVNRFTKVYMQELADEDLLIIATTLRSSANEAYLRQMIEFNSQIHIAATVQRTLGRQGSPWEFNLRDIMRWLALGENQSKLELNPDNPVEFVGDIYIERFRSLDDRQVVATLIRDAFKSVRNDMHHAHILAAPNYTQLGHSLIERKPGSRLSLHTHPILQHHLNAAQAMAKCIEKGWLVILVGTAGTGKTTLLRHFAGLYGAKLVEFHANTATDTTDLLGSFEQEEDVHEHRRWMRDVHSSLARVSQYAPFTAPDSLEWQRFTGGRRESFVQLLNKVTDEEVRMELKGCDKPLGQHDAKGRFVWLDGPLVQALKEGSWFVLDNANLCNLSVLDRLNSLCELGGTLNLTERGLVEGQVEVIRPHSQFRLFMTVDPTNGELSRAMRNRGLEINIDHVISSEDRLRLSLSRRDSVIREQGYEVRLPQIPEHLSLGPLQSLLRLLPAFDKLSFDQKVAIILQRTPRNAYGLLRRLTELQSPGDMSFSLMASQSAIIDFFQLHLARLDLPAFFLASQGLEPLLNPNLFSRLRHVELLPEVEWNSQRQDLILVLARVDAAETSSDNVLAISQKMASNHAFVGAVTPEIKEIYPILMACKSVLESVITSSSLVAESSYLTLAELWENACEITRQPTLDYSLWRTKLQDMERILQPLHHPEVKRLINIALHNLRLKSGLAMTIIWAYHKPNQDGQQRAKHLLDHLDPTNGTKRLDTQREQLRKQVFDAAALIMLEDRQVTDQLVPLHRGNEAKYLVDQDLVSLVAILQLDVLATLATMKSMPNNILERLCDITVQTPGYPRFSAVSLHALKWCLAMNRGANQKLIADALGTWLSSAWEVHAKGAEIVAQPTNLLSIMNLCAKPRRTIASIASYTSNLQISLSSVVLRAGILRQTQVENLAQLYVNDLATALQSLDKQGMTPGGIAVAPTPSELEALLHSVYLEDHLIQSLKTKIVDSYACLFGPATQVEKVKAVSTGWVYLGMLMLHLYIPSIPLDPNAVNVDLKRRLSITCKRLTDEIELQQIGERLGTGNIENLLLDSLRNRLLQEQVRLRNLPPSSDSQRDIVELQTLLSELLQFHNQLLNVERMDDMLKGLNVSQTSGTNREHVNQDSWARFLERIQTKYTTFGDIIYPVVYWMNRIRFGASLLRHSVARNQEEEKYTTTSFLESVTAFPSTLAATYLLLNIQPPPHLRPVDWASIRIGAAIVELKLGVPVDIHRHPLSNAFDQLFGLWLNEKLKQDEEERNNTSLYKSRKTEEQMRSEEELEAEEFQQLFPEYADVMEAAISESHRRLETIGDTMKPYQLFTHLLSGSTFPPNFPIYPISALHRWSNSVNSKLTWELDENTVIFQLRSTFQRLQQLRQTPTPAKGYNFYVDGNVPQVSRALEVIERMNDRLVILIRDWPDQMVLQHLSERCQAIAQLDLKSSLSKVLSALEQLLVQSDDWQRFASKEVSIEAHQQALSTLIIDWRRIELACWSHLLDFQALSFSTSLDDWWYRLYENIIHTPRAIVDEVEQTKFLADLIPLVEGFLSSSPLGQFATRLQLLEMFKSYISIAMASTNPFLLRVRTVLDSIVSLYGRFSLKIRATLSSRREEIDKDVRSFVKLASWKDINVFALKASAQRTHHHLHKCIRKFRGVLQEPISSLLSELEISDPGSEGPQQHGVSVPLIESVPSLEDRALSAHLRHLDDTLDAFHGVSCGEKQPSLDLGVNAVEDLSNTIVGTIAALQGSVTPKDAKNKTGWAKNLLTRKRKALADLLRTCRGIGLSSQLKADAQIRQSDRLWILEHRAAVHSNAEEVKTMDSYFDRILWKLPRFQASLSSHSEDVSTRDLTKLLHFVHALFGYALESRDQIRVVAEISNQLDCIVASAFQCKAENVIAFVGPVAPQVVENFLSLACYTIGSTQEIMDVASEYPQYAKELEPFNPQSILALQEQLRLLRGQKERISDIQGRLAGSEAPILLFDERELLLDSVTVSRNIMDIMNTWCTEDGRAHHICQGFVQSLEAKLQNLTELPLGMHTSLKYVHEKPIGVMLVIMQRLEAMPPLLPTEAFIKEGMMQFRRISASLDVPHLWQEIRVFLTALEGNSFSTVLLQRLLPFIQRFNMLMKAYLDVSILWAKSLFKLASILTNLGQDLADRGFCKPQDVDGQNADSDNNAKMDGTGVGEGMGDQNVTQEIEDESQVEGMQGEETQPEEKKDGRDKDDNTLEMEQDFDGDLENVEGEDEGEEDQTEDEEEVEERMENLDPADPNAVDEKLWGDKSSTKDKEDKLESEQPSKDTTQDVEMAAKQDELKSSRKQDKPEEIEAQDKNDQEDTQDEVPPEEGPDVDNQPNEAGAPMEDHVPEDEVLDLPEGLELGDQVEPVGEDVDDEFGSEGEEIEGDKNESVHDGEENADNEDASAMMDATSDIHEEEEKVDNASEPAVVAKPDEEKGQGQQDTAGGNNSLLATGEPRQAGGTDMDLEHDQANNQQSSEAIDSGRGIEGADEQKSGEHQKGMTTEGAQDNPMTEQSDQSPLRTLADALAEVQKRYQEIQTAIDHEPQQGNAHENRQSQIVEHVKEDAEDTRPALGHANENEVAKLRDLNIVDDVPDIEQDQDIQMYDDSIHQAPPLESSTYPANKLNEISLDRPHVDEEVETALTREDIRSGRDPREQSDLDAAFGIPSQNQLSMTSEEVEAQLIEWQSSTNRQEGVESIWRLYSSLTHELAWSLCEQLRLILEPTKATRLRGDYRTGKRLNMKKIIPYIASEYTKDKIWLRRTRPSQREYQVLLALDDSRSMSESHSEHLAFETLALVSKALTRLEAGDISVVKFGETVDILHGFDDGPFNDTVGAKVIGSFGFNQSSTDVLSLVETSLAVLQNARDKRGSSSSSNLWQLEIIVSDGICSNHEKLRSALRRAREQKVMVVFIIVDSLSRSASAGGAGDRGVQISILSMKQVRADLTVERYLDTFPFEYYLVLRSVDALPEVLSGTLKQFFERIAEE